MAEIEIAPLNDRLSDQEIADLAAVLERAGVPPLPRAEDPTSVSLGDGIADDTLTELLDRLEAHDLACDLYLPVDLDGRIEAGDLRVGSVQGLIDALEELRDELDIDEEEDDEDEDEDEDEGDDEYGEAVLERRLRECWHAMYSAAEAAQERHLPLHVRA